MLKSLLRDVAITSIRCGPMTPECIPGVKFFSRTVRADSTSTKGLSSVAQSAVPAALFERLSLGTSRLNLPSQGSTFCGLERDSRSIL